MTRRSTLLPLAALAAAVAVALPIASGGAQSAPRQFTVTLGKETAQFDDVAPLTMKKGQLSLGDAIVSTADLRIDGKKAGTLQSIGTITNRTPKPFSHFTAMMSMTVHLRPSGHASA